MSNVPDDWGQFWAKCSICGRKYHQSEGGCDCRDEGYCAHCNEICTRDDYDPEYDRFVCGACRTKEDDE